MSLTAYYRIHLHQVCVFLNGHYLLFGDIVIFGKAFHCNLKQSLHKSLISFCCYSSRLDSLWSHVQAVPLNLMLEIEDQEMVRLEIRLRGSQRPDEKTLSTFPSLGNPFLISHSHNGLTRFWNSYFLSFKAYIRTGFTNYDHLSSFPNEQILEILRS